MRVLITGGAGFIGTHLRRKLADDGHSIRILDNLLPQIHGSDPDTNFDGAEFIRGDVRDAAAVASAVEGIELIYHLAAETGVGQSQYEIQRYFETNTLGTAAVMQAAAESKVQHIVITSSRAVYGEGMHRCDNCEHTFVGETRLDTNLGVGNWEIQCPKCGKDAAAQAMREDDHPSPVSVYGLTKLQQEQIAGQVSQIFPVSITNLRLFNVFGPGQSLGNPYVGVLGTFFRRISSGNGIDIYEDGQMRRDFVYVGDVVEALRRAGGNEKVYGRSINIGSGEAVTLEEAGRAMFDLLGAEPQLDFSGKYRLGDIHHAVADIRRARELLDYSPSTAFSDGLAAFVGWANDQASAPGGIDVQAEQQLAERNLLRRAHQ